MQIKDAVGQGGLRPAGHRGADPLAALGPHRRRPDGRAGQPPARRGEHLHRRPCTAARSSIPLSVVGGGQPAALPARPRRRGPRLLHLRVPRARLRPQGPDRPPEEDRRAIRLDQRQRLRRLRRDGLRHQGHAGPRARAGRDALPAAPTTSKRERVRPGGGPDAGHPGQRRAQQAASPGRRRRPSQPRLHRGVGALGLVHPQSRAPRTSPAAAPEGGPGRRRDRPDDEHRRPRRASGSSSRKSGSTPTATKRPRELRRKSRHKSRAPDSHIPHGNPSADAPGL